MSRFNLLIVGIMIVSLSSFAYAGKPGDKGNTFLKLGQGARAIGMGEAYVAVADDVNSLYWNPSGIAKIEGISVTSMYSMWLDNIKYGYLAGVMPLENGVVGASISLLDSGEIDRYEVDGSNNPIPKGTFDGTNMALAVSYGREIKGVACPDCPMYLGGTVKYISGKIAGKTSKGVAFDLGGLCQTPIDGLTIAAVVTNIGPKTSAFDKEKDGLPLTLKAGAAYNQLLDKSLILAMDVNLPSDNDLNVHLGAEYRMREILAFRLGYKTDTIDEHGTMSGLTAGVGFKYPVLRLSLDYAFVKYNDLKNTHRLSLSKSW